MKFTKISVSKKLQCYLFTLYFLELYINLHLLHSFLLVLLESRWCRFTTSIVLFLATFTRRNIKPSKNSKPFRNSWKCHSEWKIMKIMNLTFKLNLKKCVRCVFCWQGIVLYLYMTDTSVYWWSTRCITQMWETLDNIKCMLYYCYWSMLSIF